MKLKNTTLTEWKMRNKSVTAVLVISAVFLTFCSKKEEESSEIKKIPVKTETIKMIDYTPVITTAGKVYSNSEMKLSFKTGGVIKKVYVEEGKQVNAGQVIASLDLSEIDAQVTQARDAFQKAGRDFERIKNLYEDSVATLEQFQNATTGYSVAKSNLEIAEFNLKYSKITAPAAGKILKKLAEENELVGSGYPVILFGDTGADYLVKIGVTDKDLVKLSAGDAAKIEIDAYPGIIFTGRLTTIGQFADPHSGTYEVEISVDSKDYKLASGFVARVSIFPSVKEKVSMIPADAVKEADKKTGIVFRLKGNDGSVEQVQVMICGIADNSVLVSSGLNEMDEVITEGAAYLTNRSKVTVIN